MARHISPSPDEDCSIAQGVDRPCFDFKISSNTVLIIEDDDGVSQVISEVISGLGLCPVCCETGADGLESLNHLNGDVLFVILDYQMPDIHASRLVPQLRAINPEIRIVLSSGYSRSHILAEYSLDDICDFIPKPYGVSELLCVISKLTQSTS